MSRLLPGNWWKLWLHTCKRRWIWPSDTSCKFCHEKKAYFMLFIAIPMSLIRTVNLSESLVSSFSGALHSMLKPKWSITSPAWHLALSFLQAVGQHWMNDLRGTLWRRSLYRSPRCPSDHRPRPRSPFRLCNNAHMTSCIIGFLWSFRTWYSAFVAAESLPSQQGICNKIIREW